MTELNGPIETYPVDSDGFLIESPGVHAAPRRFDLFTVFVVLSAFAALFGIFQFTPISADWSLSLLSLFVIVGASQAFLFNGNYPRQASIISGIVAWVTIVIIRELITPAGQKSSMTLADIILPSAICGGIIGYVVGVMVGGVFWMVELLRKFLPGKKSTAEYSIEMSHPLE